MDYPEFKQIVEPIFKNPIEGTQEEIIQHLDDPLWVIAGPGSGKTEVLVLRTLKLIYVDRIPPKSIIITTFTKKAAKNLMDRILNYLPAIYARFPELERDIDIHQLRIGTLHSLCTDIMQEYKYPLFENFRLLDEIEQVFFLYDHSILINDWDDRFAPVWVRFNFLLGNYSNKFIKTKAAVKLFNRITEDRINLEQLRTASPEMALLVEAYESYLVQLETHRRCDYSYLQQKFLNFLDSDLGQLFISGDGDLHPGINYVMVDEYQDTNPIQEQIYMDLSESTHNLCVVGDDDQALYRFRGGTVDCMITFDQACERNWGIPRQVIIDNQKFLNRNYRSHAGIVAFFDNYIQTFPEMQLEGARVQGKPPLAPHSSIMGGYPAVAYIMGRTIDATAVNFAHFVRSLIDQHIIEDPSQCVVLMRSVKDNSTNAGPFMRALQAQNIPVYNPRSKSFLLQEEVQLALGALLKILDPLLRALDAIRSPRIQTQVRTWVGFYDRYIQTHPNMPQLDHYVSESIRRIPLDFPIDTWMDLSILEIFYRIIAHDPFKQWQNDPERTFRLGQITKIIESYSSIPYPNRIGSNRGQLKRSSIEREGVSFNWRRQFYYELIQYLTSEGLNDPEDEEIICPEGRLPIMTVHQVKGLQFPFVFVFGLNDTPRVDATIQLENIFLPFRQNASLVNLQPNQKAVQDLIRFYFVAYSRPQYALIHLIPRAHRLNAYGYPDQNSTQYFTNMENTGGRLYDRAPVPRT